MRLVPALLGLGPRKLVLLAGLMLLLFAGLLLARVVVPSIREAASDRERLQQVTAERLALEDDLDRLEGAAADGRSASAEFFETQVASEIEDLNSSVVDARSEVEQRRAQDDAAVLADPDLTPEEKLDRIGEGP